MEKHKLTKSLPSAVIYELECSTDLTQTVLSPKGGIIELPIYVPTIQGYIEHLKDKEIPIEHGYWTNFIQLPPIKCYRQDGRIFLNKIQAAANLIIKMCQSYDHSDLKNEWLTKQVLHYYEEVCSSLSGKSGVLSKHVFSYRAPNSMMFVCTGDKTLEQDEVRVPKKDADKLDIVTGSLVMYFRHPILHKASVRFARAVVSECPTGAIPFASFKGMNADCDGDLIGLIKIPENLIANPKVLVPIFMDMELMRKTSQYADTLLLENKTKNVPKDNYIEDIDNRLKVTGLSFGPEDFVDIPRSKFLTKMVENVKPLKATFSTIYKGEADLSKISMDIFQANYGVKTNLGIVGRLGADSIACALYGGKQYDSKKVPVVDSACYIKEKLTQQVLDCKHGQDVTNVNTVISMLNRQGEFKNTTPEEIINQLVEFGYDKDMVEPIVNMPTGGVMNFITQNCPFIRAVTNANPKYIIDFESGLHDKGGLGQYMYQLNKNHNFLEAI